MRRSRIINLPANPKEIFDYALSKSYNNWVDEKGTKDHPNCWRREQSKLSYEEAFNIIQNSRPLWGIVYRNMKYINDKEEDYWEFGGCNISSNNYGEVYIWICVNIDEAEKIFKKFNLIKD